MRRRIIACHTEDDVATAVSGSNDTKECQAKIVKIMEGGKEAFERPERDLSGLEYSVTTFLVSAASLGPRPANYRA